MIRCPSCANGVERFGMSHDFLRSIEDWAIAHVIFINIPRPEGQCNLNVYRKCGAI